MQTHLSTTGRQNRRRRTIGFRWHQAVDAEPEANRIRVSQPEYYLPWWFDAGVPPARHGLDTRVRSRAHSLVDH